MAIRAVVRAAAFGQKLSLTAPTKRSFERQLFTPVRTFSVDQLQGFPAAFLSSIVLVPCRRCFDLLMNLFQLNIATLRDSCCLMLALGCDDLQRLQNTHMTSCD